MLDGKNAVAEVKDDQRPKSIYTRRRSAGPSRGCGWSRWPRRKFAQPGDNVDFTIRFDNIGNQAIGNVTIIDSLTTRLEYVPGSAQSSRQAEFSTEPNEGDSLVLRWEFVDALGAGEGGMVRFHCKVR